MYEYKYEYKKDAGSDKIQTSVYFMAYSFRRGEVIHLILRSDDRNAFLNVMALFDFVDHRDGVIRVGDNAFALVVEC